MNIIVNDLVTQYSLTGQGKLVLLLHGWGDNSSGLADLNARLSKQYRVLALDLPGFGGTQLPTEAWDLDAYASFINQALAKLDVGQPYAVIGHSNGGAVAIRAAATGRVVPSKLVLMGAAGIRNTQSGKRALLSIIAKLGNIATLWLPATTRQRLRATLYGSIGSDLLVVPGMEATFKKTVRQDVQSDAGQLKLPTLLIYGATDQATPPAYGKRYQQLIESSRLEVIEGAGHFVHLDRPDQVGQLIESFLAL